MKASLAGTHVGLDEFLPPRSCARRLWSLLGRSSLHLRRSTGCLFTGTDATRRGLSSETQTKSWDAENTAGQGGTLHTEAPSGEGTGTGAGAAFHLLAIFWAPGWGSHGGYFPFPEGWHVSCTFWGNTSTHLVWASSWQASTL